MEKRSFKNNKSGQVIIISALLVALLLLSTAIYVVETQKQTPAVALEREVFFGYQQAARNTLISALANATGGGSIEILATDLSELKSAIHAHSFLAFETLDFAVLSIDNYYDGIRISRGTDGKGISSVFVTFWVNASNPQASSNLEYNLNITSSVTSTGITYQIDENATKIAITVQVFNEDKPALANRFAISYQNQTDWVGVNAPNITSFGNGTYIASFSAPTIELLNPAVVSLECIDSRGITIGTTFTCNSV